MKKALKIVFSKRDAAQAALTHAHVNTLARLHMGLSVGGECMDALAALDAARTSLVTAELELDEAVTVANVAEVALEAARVPFVAACNAYLAEQTDATTRALVAVHIALAPDLIESLNDASCELDEHDYGYDDDDPDAYNMPTVLALVKEFSYLSDDEEYKDLDERLTTAQMVILVRMNLNWPREPLNAPILPVLPAEADVFVEVTDVREEYSIERFHTHRRFLYNVMT